MKEKRVHFLDTIQNSLCIALHLVCLSAYDYLHSYFFSVWVADVQFLPISELQGSNLQTRVNKDVCSWWNGACLFEALDAIMLRLVIQMPHSGMQDALNSRWSWSWWCFGSGSHFRDMIIHISVNWIFDDLAVESVWIYLRLHRYWCVLTVCYFSFQFLCRLPIMERLKDMGTVVIWDWGRGYIAGFRPLQCWCVYICCTLNSYVCTVLLKAMQVL